MSNIIGGLKWEKGPQIAVKNVAGHYGGEPEDAGRGVMGDIGGEDDNSRQDGEKRRWLDDGKETKVED